MEAELHSQPFLELWVNFIAKAVERKVSIIYLSCRADFSTHKGLHIPLFHVLYGGFITLWSSALGLHTSISQMRWGIWFCNNDSLLRSPDSCRLCLYSPNCLWMKLIPAASQPSQTHLSEQKKAGRRQVESQENPRPGSFFCYVSSVSTSMIILIFKIIASLWGNRSPKPFPARWVNLIVPSCCRFHFHKARSLGLAGWIIDPADLACHACWVSSVPAILPWIKFIPPHIICLRNLCLAGLSVHVKFELQ